MNNSQKELLKFLKHGIRGEKAKLKSNFNLEKFLKLAEEHKIKGIIYSAIKKEKYNNDVIMEELKRDTFMSALSQRNHLNEVYRVFTKLNEAEIEVIALKGLVIRELYPIPDLRTMCDSDILVREKDLVKVGEVLEELGYNKNEEKDEHGAHFVYLAPHYYPIEVHWTLINDDFFKGDKGFENNIWNNVIQVNVNGAEVKGLSLEYLAFHLCSHMAVHMVYGGFGLRQLCDLVLLVEKRGREIDWDKFLSIVYSSGIEKFVFTIFYICKELFDLRIPFITRKNIKIKRKYINYLIEDIFKDGIHASKDMCNTFANEFAFDKDDTSGFKKFMLFIFPPANKLDEKYWYAKKNKILIPMAWIHHLIIGVFRKEYSFKDKFKFILLTGYISNKKNKLLRWLEL